MHKILNLQFLPSNVDAGLLVLRAWLGLSMLLLHGQGKLMGFNDIVAKGFPDPFGVGVKASLGMAVFAEVACAAFLVVGFLTRFSALLLTITMGVAFFLAHGMALKGANSGELSFIYLAGYLTLLIAGAGRFSLDSKVLGHK